jgi:hypothetical protein
MSHARLLVCLLLTLTFFAPAAVAGDQAPAPVKQSDEVQSNGSPAAPQLLTDDEVKELTARAEEPSSDVAGGALSNEHLTYIVIALAAAIIVLIAK